MDADISIIADDSREVGFYGISEDFALLAEFMNFVSNFFSYVFRVTVMHPPEFGILFLLPSELVVLGYHDAREQGKVLEQVDSLRHLVYQHHDIVGSTDLPTY